MKQIALIDLAAIARAIGLSAKVSLAQITEVESPTTRLHLI